MPCQLFSEVSGEVFSSATAILVSFTGDDLSFAFIPGARSRSSGAAKLVAIGGDCQHVRSYPALRLRATTIGMRRCEITRKISGGKPWAGGFRIAARGGVIHIAAVAMHIMCGGAVARRRSVEARAIFSCPIPPVCVDVLTRHARRCRLQANGDSPSSWRPSGCRWRDCSQAVATAPPDGYTLIMVASGHATNSVVYSRIPYDTFKDFTPVSLLASSPNILLVRADSPSRTLARCDNRRNSQPGSSVLQQHRRQMHVDAVSPSLERTAAWLGYCRDYHIGHRLERRSARTSRILGDDASSETGVKS